MNAALLLEHYARISDAPDAVALLRRFVLDLAVRGKLVEQDGRDEPASALLKRIATEKAKLRLRASANPIAADKPPFQLPTGWQWTTIGEVCSKTGSGSTPRGGKEVYKSNGFPFLRSQNVYDDGLRLDDVAFIDVETHQRMGSTKVLARDLLLNITGGSMGRCCRVPDDFDEANVSQHVAILRVAVCGTEGFLHLLVRSPYFQAFIFAEQTGAGRGGLPKNRMDNIAVALPPLTEQHRIVAKVDELMALCDQLEAVREEREAARDMFTLSTLAKLNTPDPETFEQDARFALANLAPLTTRPDQIKQLRQTIINLAVLGKLVEQNPNDEPAAELLKRISCEKTKGFRGRNPGREGSLETLQPDDMPFSIPGSWAWCGATYPAEQVSDVGKKVQTKDVLASGKHPVVDQGKVFIRGYCNDDEKLIRVDVPVVVFGDHTRETKLVDFNFIVGADGVKILKPILIQPAFYYLCLLWLPLESRGYGRHFKLLRDAKIPLPPLTEQLRIVTKVDELMALCDQLEASITMSEQTRSRLLESILHEALEPA